MRLQCTTAVLLLLLSLRLQRQVNGYQILPALIARSLSRSAPSRAIRQLMLGDFDTLVMATRRCPQHSVRLGAVSTGNDDPDDFPDYTTDRFDAKTAAPTTDRDNYIPESAQAQQANDLLLQYGSQTTIELQNELSNSFLQYALSIIMGRAIPDARDGLKPVHRRILFAMHELQLTASGNYRKCARVVGDVLGKLHPHGDTAVYDALVRLAQDFTTNHPLVDGHGNFGSIDADPAAAMRYTECRLSPLSQGTLLADLGEDTVDMIPNFDGTSSEPVVLPAKVPVLLLNGSSGIAVGMATNIPPHNLREILSACQAIARERITGQPLSTDQLLKIVPGPDFPTGALMMGTDGAKKMYTTGNGSVVLRAVTNVEQVKAGKTGRTAIIVTELPYQVNKAALLEKIAELVNDKKLEGIADLRDESSGREGIRMVIELKRDAVPAVVLANLYQKTSLQTTFAGNLLALMAPNGKTTSLVPQRFTLRQSLDCFMDFRFETMRRKAAFQLRKVDSRVHIVAGLLLALEKMDAVIEAVRRATNAAEAKRILQDELLGTTEEQTDAILRMQLGQLTRLNKGKLEEERGELVERKLELTRLMEVDTAVYDEMIDEFEQFSKKFGVPRRTLICADEEGEQNELDLIQNSRSVIVVTRGGYIKRMPLTTFTSQNRGTRGKRATAAGGDNEVAYTFSCNDHDTLLMVSDSGTAFGIRAYQVPTSSATARGNPIPSVLPQLRNNEAITTVLPVSEFSNEDEFLLLATEYGWLKKTPLAAFGSLTNRGLVAAKLDAGDRLLWCQRCHDGEDVLVGTRNGMACRFPVDTVRPTARTSRGVRIMKLREGDTIADVNVLDASGQGHTLVISSCGFGKRVLTSLFASRSRGQIGVVALKFKKDYEGKDAMICLRAVKDDDEVLLTTANGIMVRQKVADISAQGRATTGVLVQKLDEGDSITSVSVVPKHDEEDKDRD